MAVPLIVCSQEVSYQYDANGNRIGRRIVAKKMNNNNINPSDSTILANADENILKSKALEHAPTLNENKILNIYPKPHRRKNNY